jgi:hypothetical protein
LCDLYTIKFKKYIFCLFIWLVLILAGSNLHASDSLIEKSSEVGDGLGYEPLLHAAGAPTADVLHKKENYVNFPELEYDEGIPPLFPLISWQWQIK